MSSDSVTTPEGTFPIAGCDFSAADQTVTVMKTTTAGQILCVLTIWIFLLGLLFLLDKKPHTTGAVVVTVNESGHLTSGTTIPDPEPSWSRDGYAGCGDGQWCGLDGWSAACLVGGRSCLFRIRRTPGGRMTQIETGRRECGRR